MKRATVLALLLLAAPAAAEPTPIPQTESATPFLGAPAVQQPIVSPDPPRHPFMAPNGKSNLHNDAYQTDSYQGPGPLGNQPQVLSTFYSADCASITFDSKGRLITVCVGLAGPTLRMLDPVTLDELANFMLPPRGLPNPERPSPFNDFGGGGYFYLDHQDRAVLPTTNGHVYVVGQTPDAPGFRLEADHDLTGAIAANDKVFSALPDWSGRIWFASTQGVVGFVDPATSAIAATDLGEKVSNSFAVDELGGIYLVSTAALYRFGVQDGKPAVTWKQVYPNSGIAKPGQGDAGSGTTPTITPRGHVAITDNADPMNVLLYDRVTGTEICRTPVFAQGASASDNSLVSFGDALIVENNYGYSGPTTTEQGNTTTPGIWRVDYDPSSGTCGVTWKSDEISPTVVPKVSLANGLLYAWTKPAGEESDPWYLTAIDARTGTTVFKQLAGTGLGYNNNYAPITIGPDGTVYQGVLGGMVAIRDATPPPGAAPPTGTPQGPACAALPGPGVRPVTGGLRLVPNGLADVLLHRFTVRGGTVVAKRVRTLRGVDAPRTLPPDGLKPGTYVVAFRSGRDLRRRVVRLRGGAFTAAPQRLDAVRSCARASSSQALFDRRGLRVEVTPTDPTAKVVVAAHRGKRVVRPSRVVQGEVVRVLLRPGRGTWRVRVTVAGRRIATLVATRPR